MSTAKDKLRHFAAERKYARISLKESLGGSRSALKPSNLRGRAAQKIKQQITQRSQQGVDTVKSHPKLTAGIAVGAVALLLQKPIRNIINKRRNQD